jgi:Zn-dependent metalloprotease
MAQETNSKTSRLGIVKTNAKTGVVSLVYNVNDTNSFKGNAEEMAFRFITSHSKEFLKGESAGSKHLKTIKSPAGNHVGYIQTVAGVPVIGAITAVNINKENKVTFVANHYQPGIKVSTQPKISAVQAIGIARQSFTNTGFKTVIENKTELSVFVTDNQVPLLVWKVNMLPDFGGDWYFLIDALTGEIVKKENIEMNVNGTGKVFDPDPGSYFQDATLPDNNDANYFADQNVYKTRTLPGLNSPVSGYY